MRSSRDKHEKRGGGQMLMHNGSLHKNYWVRRWRGIEVAFLWLADNFEQSQHLFEVIRIGHCKRVGAVVRRLPSVVEASAAAA